MPDTAAEPPRWRELLAPGGGLASSFSVHRLPAAPPPADPAVDVGALLRDGRDALVLGGPAGGCPAAHQTPLLEHLAGHRDDRALLLHHDAATSRLRRAGWQKHAGAAGGEPHAAVLDAQTSPGRRRSIRSRAAAVFADPQTLHAAVLPRHSQWAGFLQNLRFVVVDDLHRCGGVPGGHLANVLRRLARLCRHYGADPMMLAVGPTVADPATLGAALLGRTPAVHAHAALQAPRDLVLCRPPTDESLAEAARIVARLVAGGRRVAGFVACGNLAEPLHRAVRKELVRTAPGLVAAVRIGKAERHRRDGRELDAGTLRAVVADDAATLGAGRFDAVVMLGCPADLVRTRRQVARSCGPDAVSVVVCGDGPTDRMLPADPHAVLHGTLAVPAPQAGTPQVLREHLRCAAFELPLEAEDRVRFGPRLPEIAEELRRAGELTNAGGDYYWSRPDGPSVVLPPADDATALAATAHPAELDPHQPHPVAAGSPSGGGIQREPRMDADERE